VITPSMTWVSLPNLATLMGARPVFCDIDPATLNLDLDEVESLITSRTKAIVPVHFAGRPVDLDRLRGMAESRGIIVIEDACHAVGASYKSRKIGGRSPLCAFSFHPNKNMTTAEGGMLTGTDGEKLKKARLLRFHGVSRDTYQRTGSGALPHYATLFPGLKYNMTDLAASIGIHQLKKVDGFNQQRKDAVGKYKKALDGAEGIWTPPPSAEDGSLHSWHLFNVCVPDVDSLRERVMERLLKDNIQIGLHYLPVHQMPGMTERGFGRSLPFTEKVGRTIMSLPLFPGIEDSVIEYVAERFLAAVRQG